MNQIEQVLAVALTDVHFDCGELPHGLIYRWSFLPYGRIDTSVDTLCSVKTFTSFQIS